MASVPGLKLTGNLNFFATHSATVTIRRHVVGSFHAWGAFSGTRVNGRSSFMPRIVITMHIILLFFPWRGARADGRVSLRG